MAIPKVELTKKWWVTSRPKDVKGAELEKALAAVEQAEKVINEKKDSTDQREQQFVQQLRNALGGANDQIGNMDVGGLGDDKADQPPPTPVAIGLT